MRSLDGQVGHVERVRRGMGVWRHHAPRPAPRDVGRLHVSRQLPLPFVAAVLEPDFNLKYIFDKSKCFSLSESNLSFCEMKGGCELSSLAA